MILDELDKFYNNKNWVELKKYLEEKSFLFQRFYDTDYKCRAIEDKAPKKDGQISYGLYIQRMLELLHLNFSEERIGRIRKACEGYEGFLKLLESDEGDWGK